MAKYEMKYEGAGTTFTRFSANNNIEAMLKVLWYYDDAEYSLPSAENILEDMKNELPDNKTLNEYCSEKIANFDAFDILCYKLFDLLNRTNQFVHYIKNLTTGEIIFGNDLPTSNEDELLSKEEDSEFYKILKDL